MQLFRIVLHARARHRHFGTPPEEQERSALLLDFFSSIVAQLMSVLGKLCGAAGVHFFTLVAARSSVLCLLICPVLVKHRVNPFSIAETAHLRLLRGVLGFSSLTLWYVSLHYLPRSDANSLSMSAPAFVALLAPWVLKERTSTAVYLSMPFCLGGMLMVAQPTWLFGAAAGTTSTIGVVAAILQAVLSAASKLTIGALKKHNEPLKSILFSMGFVSTLGAILGCLVLPGEQFSGPSQAVGWAYLAATCLLALAVQSAFTSALQRCNAAKAASLDYFSLIWTLLADGLIFHKLPNRLSMAGAAVITAASLASVLWGLRAAAGDTHAAAAAARPQQYKQQHYLGGEKKPSRQSGGMHGAGYASPGSSEGEAVSLIKAAAADGWSNQQQDIEQEQEQGQQKIATGCWPWQGCKVGMRAETGKAAAAASAGGADSGKHAAKLAQVTGCLTDSSKSWRLGTEVETALAADNHGQGGSSGSSCSSGSGGCGGAEERSAVGSGGNQGDAGCGSSAGDVDAGCSGASPSSCCCMELQAVATVAAAMRTSTEKEQALAAAGK